MEEGFLTVESASAREGTLVVSLGLPWYRSLPLSCIEHVDVAVAGARATGGDVRVRVGSYDGTISGAATTEGWWDLRDRLEVLTGIPVLPGQRVVLEVTLHTRVPYIRTGPSTPFVRRTHAVEEVVVA